MGEAKIKRAQLATPRPPRLNVAICIPSQSMVHADMAMSLSVLCVHAAQHFGIAVVNEKNSMITQARNRLVQRALDLKADYVLFMDSDMKFPFDALLRLVTHDKDIVGATYNKRVPPYETLGRFLGPQRDLSKGGLIECEFLPTGFLLIKTSVFRAMSEPNRREQIWFREHYDRPETEPTRYIGEDVAFCLMARAAGFEVWCDLTLTSEIIHIGENFVTCHLPPPEQQAAAA